MTGINKATDSTICFARFQMTIHYQVHLPAGVAVEINAASINLGIRRLWFYDTDENLLAVFRWENIVGFSVKESAEGQVITYELLHEKKKVEQLEHTKGPVLATIERVHQTLQKVTDELNSAFLKIYDGIRDKDEKEFLKQRYENDVRNELRQLTGDQRDLQEKLTKIVEQVKSILMSA